MMLIHATSTRSSYEGATSDEAALLRGSFSHCLTHARIAIDVVDSALRREHYFQTWYQTPRISFYSSSHVH